MTKTAKDLFGKCAQRTIEPYLDGMITIKDFSPQGHVLIEHTNYFRTKTKWLDPSFFHNWTHCRDDTWKPVSGRQLIGRCVTRIKKLGNDNNFTDCAVLVKNVMEDGKIITNNSFLDPVWNDGNWVIAPFNMRCITGLYD